MRRVWVAWAIALVTAVTVSVGWVWVRRAAAAAERQRNYVAQFREYSAATKAGMTRPMVEGALRRKGIQFTQSCCLGPRNGAYEDHVKIGEEPAPWYCSERWVIVNFHFAGSEPGGYPDRARDEDVLRDASLDQQLGGCL